MRVLVSIPHGGTAIPEELKDQYIGDFDRLRHHEDFGTLQIGRLQGYDLIFTEWSRFVADLNRARDDVKGERGVIMREDFHGKPVLKKDLTKDEVEYRLEKYYDPYYEELKEKLRNAQDTFVLDIHSMDSAGNLGAQGERPDIDIASGNGRTAAPKVRKIFVEEFSKEGFEVKENEPYAGLNARVINFCCEEGAQAIELEINKKLYMDEDTLELDCEAIGRLQGIIRRILDRIANL